MWSLRWHLTKKSLTGAHYIIKSYSLSHSWTLWWRVRWLKHAGRGGTAAAVAQNEQTTEEHSTLEQQSSGRLDHPVWCVMWTVWAAYWLRLHSGVLQAMRPRLATTATGARNKAKPQWRHIAFSADKRYMCFQPLYNKCYSDKPLKAKFHWLLEVCIDVTTATGGCSWQRERKPRRNKQFGKIIHTPQMPL